MKIKEILKEMLSSSEIICQPTKTSQNINKNHE